MSSKVFNILIVDSNPSIRLILRQMLEFDGNIVYEAISEKEGFQVLKKFPCDIAIINLEFYGCFNPKVLKKIVKENPDLFVIGLADEKDLLLNVPNGEDAKTQLGIDALFVSPVDWQDILNEIQKLRNCKLGRSIGSRRVLVVDDNREIHNDFKKILVPEDSPIAELEGLSEILFGTDETLPLKKENDFLDCQLYSAFSGDEAVEKVEELKEDGSPVDLIFMDVRMPPGIDGIEASSQIRLKNPNLGLVICSAYADYSWDKIVNDIGSTENLQFLRKPFESDKVREIVSGIAG